LKSLIAAAPQVPRAICLESADRKRRGDNSNAGAEMKRVVPFKVEFF